MSFVQAWQELRMGECSPEFFKNCIEETRVGDLSLSAKIFEKFHLSGTTCMDLDVTEHRYFITVGKDSKIALYDTWMSKKNSKGGSFIPKIASVGHRQRHDKYIHGTRCSTVQWYPHDTGMFVTGSYDMSVKAWDSNRMKPAGTIKVNKSIYDINMSTCPTQSLVACATSHHLRMIDLSTGCCTHTFRGHHQPVLTTKWSPRQSHIVVSASQDGQVLMWDVRRAGHPVLSLDHMSWISSRHSAKRSRNEGKAHEGMVNSLCFTPDGNFLLTYATDNHLRLWDVCSGKIVPTNYGEILNGSKHQALHMAIYDGGQNSVVFVPSKRNLYMYDLHTGEPVASLLNQIGTVQSCVLNPLSQDLYVMSKSPSIAIYSPNSLKCSEITINKEKYERTVSDKQSETVQPQAENNWSDSDSADDGWS